MCSNISVIAIAKLKSPLSKITNFLLSVSVVLIKQQNSDKDTITVG